MSTDDDHAKAPLERRARAGDPAARAELLGQLQVTLVRFCYRYTGDAHVAEDVAQDVFAAVASEANWPRGALRAWLFRLARNRCVDISRRRHDANAGAGTFFSDSKHPSPGTGPSTAFARQEREDLLRQLLAELPHEIGEVLLLRYFENLGRLEIAEVLELPESTVRSRLLRGRKELQRKLGDTQP